MGGLPKNALNALIDFFQLLKKNIVYAALSQNAEVVLFCNVLAKSLGIYTASTRTVNASKSRFHMFQCKRQQTMQTMKIYNASIPLAKATNETWQCWSVSFRGKQLSIWWPWPDRATPCINCTQFFICHASFLGPLNLFHFLIPNQLFSIRYPFLNPYKFDWFSETIKIRASLHLDNANTLAKRQTTIAASAHNQLRKTTAPKSPQTPPSEPVQVLPYISSQGANMSRSTSRYWEA